MSVDDTKRYAGRKRVQMGWQGLLGMTESRSRREIQPVIYFVLLSQSITVKADYGEEMGFKQTGEMA